LSGTSAPGARPALRDPGPVAAALIAFVLLWIGLFLVLPLLVVVEEAFARGLPAFRDVGWLLEITLYEHSGEARDQCQEPVADS